MPTVLIHNLQSLWFTSANFRIVLKQMYSVSCSYCQVTSLSIINHSVHDINCTVRLAIQTARISERSEKIGSCTTAKLNVRETMKWPLTENQMLQGLKCMLYKLEDQFYKRKGLEIEKLNQTNGKQTNIKPFYSVKHSKPFSYKSFFVFLTFPVRQVKQAKLLPAYSVVLIGAVLYWGIGQFFSSQNIRHAS